MRIPPTSLLDYEYTGLSKVISGGQCGADQGGIVAAFEFGVLTGGCAPKGWRTAEGPAPELQFLGLREHYSDDYVPRTKLNVKEADGTLIIASNLESAGSRLTISSCHKMGRPYIILQPNYTEEDLVKLLAWTLANRIGVLNVAGNRDSFSSTRHFDATHQAVTWLLVNLKDLNLLKQPDINT